MAVVLGLDIGSNSVGSAWIDTGEGSIDSGVSVFPAGVDESDDKRGEPKNAKRRMARRTRITLARRTHRKRALRIKLIENGLLPPTEKEFKRLVDATDPWELRRKGLDEALDPYEFGRVLLHLAQRRGALGLKLADPDDPDAADTDDGKVKAAIGEVRAKMLNRKVRTFGEFISVVKAERVTAITSEDRRPVDARNGRREYSEAIRNKAGSYEHCADRAMIRDEFSMLWDAQVNFGGPTSRLLTCELRRALDDDSGDATWRHRGLLFGQRRASWDLGTLGRCVLEPTERCAPHADMHASRYLVVETINNLKIVERGMEPRSITQQERKKIREYLSGPLGVIKTGKSKGQPKRTVSVTDLRNLMGWGRATKTTPFRFNIETDPDRKINTDWFTREIVHGAIGPDTWGEMSADVREGINRLILRFNPDETGDAERLRSKVTSDWAGLDDTQADALLAVWQKRPRTDAKRLNMSRRAVRNLLTVMDAEQPWPDPKRPGQTRWLTQIEARKLIAGDAGFEDATIGKPFDDHARRRYATGAKGATARDRYYMSKHVLMKGGKPMIGPDEKPLSEPPPAPLISNPVVRKAIHEVRRHVVEYMITFGRKPDAIHIELSREAKMGKKDSDRLLFKNRLRNRIRNDIAETFHLHSVSSTQKRTAAGRVVLSVQQGGVCPLCGKAGLTPRLAATGEGCEVAHIIPKACGGHNGFGNIVLSHTDCNRRMGRQTPRQFWANEFDGAFEEGVSNVEQVFGEIQRPKPSEIKNATGDSLWSCYFSKRDDAAKIERFKLDVSDAEIQGMTLRQDAATKYAARQVMTYLADALYDGKGLPERSTGNETQTRKIFATDGFWTSRLRREWGLFFDPHQFKAKGIDDKQEHERKEKDRGDHRHHAIDAVVIALCSQAIQIAWEERERRADRDGINTANEEAMDNYRRLHPLKPPSPFKNRDDLREAVRLAVFNDGNGIRPVCHRPVKRKLVGALHEETLFGPVLDSQGEATGNFTAKKSVLDLKVNHLRMPRRETKEEAIDRLAKRRKRQKDIDEKAARKWARAFVASAAYAPAFIDPPPGKSGIVRDQGMRRRIRQCIAEGGYDADSFSATEIKKLVEAGALRQTSGVPIKSVVLLRTMADPVVIDRRKPDHATGRMIKSTDPASKRVYVGGNNHHIEIRVARNKNVKSVWSGEIVTAYEASRRKLAKLRAFRKAGIPKPDAFRQLPDEKRAELTPVLRDIESAHPIVDRRDDDDKGGRFVMSVCEGETLMMKHKHTGDIGYFVVAKLDKPRSIVVVPHWDARPAGERKNSEGKPIPDSKREQFSVTPTDLKTLAPPDLPHAVKVRVTPLGRVWVLDRD